MAQLNIQTILPVLDQSVSKLKTQYEQKRTAYNAIYKRGPKDWVNGKGERIPNLMRRAGGVTYGNEGFSFNAPINPTFDDMYVYPTANAIPYELSGRTIRNFNKGSAESQISGIADYIKIVAEALMKDIERGMWGDGSGLRATVASDDGTSVITLATTPAAGFGSTKGATFLEVGYQYDVYSSAAAYRGVFTCTATTATTATGTTSFTFGDFTAGDILVPLNGYLKTPRGFAYLVSNGSGEFQAILRSTYLTMKSAVTDLGGAAMTVSDFDQSVALLEIRGDEITSVNGFKAWMPRAQFSQMCRLGQNLKRFTGGEQTYNGGFQAFTYGNLTVAVCLEIDEDRSYFTQDSNTFIVEEMPWGVYDLDGLQLRMKAGPGGNGSDAYNGAIGSQWNLGLYLPNNATLIKRASVTGLPTQVSAYQ